MTGGEAVFGLVLAVILLGLAGSIVIGFIAALITWPWFRYLVGVGLIYLIWSNTTGADTGLAWFGTVIVGLMMLSPWLLFIGIGGFIIGFLITRK